MRDQLLTSSRTMSSSLSAAPSRQSVHDEETERQKTPRRASKRRTMDSLLAGYGSDSSGSSRGSAAAASGKDVVERERATTPATAPQTSPMKPGSSVADTSGDAAAAAAASAEATDPLRDDTDREESPGRKRPKLPSASVASSSAPCTSSNAADSGFRWPPPETRNDEAADATLIHWSKDYLTPLQQRAEKAIAAASASSVMAQSPWRAGFERTSGQQPVAFALQNSHEFTNPHQLKDAATRLNIADALGSTLRTHDDKCSPNGAASPL
jgi:hypothetical protein